MCHIKTREKIIDDGDINNLIVGIVLRQRGSFDFGLINKTAKYHLKGSQISINNKDLNAKITHTLDIYTKNRFFSYKDGNYYRNKLTLTR